MSVPNIFQSAEWASVAALRNHMTIVDRQNLFLTTTKLWQLFEIAIEDLEKVVEDKENYYVNMNRWHKPIDYHPITGRLAEMCVVCMGGSVLAKTMEWNKNQVFLSTPSTPYNLKKRLYAINSLRQGGVNDAVRYMESKSEEDMNDLANTYEDFIVSQYMDQNDFQIMKPEWDRILYYLKKMDI